jgi:hypothetical protein
MKNADAQRGNAVIAPGLSPRPLASIKPLMEESPSIEPDTPSPNALLDAPVTMTTIAAPERIPNVTVEKGVVTFGK